MISNKEQLRCFGLSKLDMVLLFEFRLNPEFLFDRFSYRAEMRLYFDLFYFFGFLRFSRRIDWNDWLFPLEDDNLETLVCWVLDILKILFD